MPRALRVCPTPRCPELTSGGRCPACQAEAQQRKGTRQQRGYGTAHTNRFRPGVLRRDPLCVCEDPDHGHGKPCLAPSTVADHHPRSRRELVRLRLDPDDPRHGRGLCASCHNRSTAQLQPGGWHARP